MIDRYGAPEVAIHIFEISTEVQVFPKSCKSWKYRAGKRINGEVATGGKQLSTDDLVNIIIQIYLK